MYNYAERMSIAQSSPIRELAKLMSDPELISFGGGNPAPEAFPIDDFVNLTKKVLEEQGKVILQYGETDGSPSLRETALEYIVRPRGVKAELENIMTLTGSVQGFDLMSKVFTDKGDVVLVENASFLGALQSFMMTQCQIVGVEMDDYGMIMEDLEQKMKELHPKLLYTIPTFQNPTGKTLPLDRRKKIAELAEKYNVVVIEDDPYCDLRYRGEPLPPIKTFDKADMVVMFNSFSKILAPGLRLGVVVAHPDIIQRMSLCRQAAVGSPDGLSEALAVAYLRSGLLPEQIKRIVPIYGERCDLMASCIDKYFPEGTKYVLPDGGMFLWVELPSDTIDCGALNIKALREAKVAYISGEDCCTIPGAGKNALRLAFSTAPKDKMEIGMKRLGEFFKAHI